MMNDNVLKGISDAIVEGSASLGLTLGNGLYEAIKCEPALRCKQGRCPNCTARVNDALLTIDRSTSIKRQSWRRSVFALHSLTVPNGNTNSLPITDIANKIRRSIDHWRRFAVQVEDRPPNEHFACVSTFGLVEDAGTEKQGKRVMLVEFAVTGVSAEADFDVLESLMSSFDGRVSSVPFATGRGVHAAPSEGLMFGFMKRRLDRPERPMVISNKKLLAEMASNYGPEDATMRCEVVGLEPSGDGFIFASASDLVMPPFFHL